MSQHVEPNDLRSTRYLVLYEYDTREYMYGHMLYAVRTFFSCMQAQAALDVSMVGTFFFLLYSRICARCSINEHSSTADMLTSGLSNRKVKFRPGFEP